MLKDKSIKQDHLALGVCYYPEHWDESIWASDLDRMLAFLDERYLTPVAAEQAKRREQRAAEGLAELAPRTLPDKYSLPAFQRLISYQRKPSIAISTRRSSRIICLISSLLFPAGKFKAASAVNPARSRMGRRRRITTLSPRTEVSART